MASHVVFETSWSFWGRYSNWNDMLIDLRLWANPKHFAARIIENTSGVKKIDMQPFKASIKMAVNIYLRKINHHFWVPFFCGTTVYTNSFKVESTFTPRHPMCFWIIGHVVEHSERSWRHSGRSTSGRTCAAAKGLSFGLWNSGMWAWGEGKDGGVFFFWVCGKYHVGGYLGDIYIYAEVVKKLGWVMLCQIFLFVKNAHFVIKASFLGNLWRPNRRGHPKWWFSTGIPPKWPDHSG